MATFTPRLGLRMPDYTDPESVISDIDNNLQAIDDAINANSYTSSTRPVNPYNGRLIYESDTKLLAIYVAESGWTYIGGAGFARGKRAVVTAVSDSATATTVEIGPYISVTFTVETGRRYWVETIYNVGYTGAGLAVSGRPRVRWAAGASVSTASTQIDSDAYANHNYGQGSSTDFYQLYEFVPNINGQITVGLFLFPTDSTRPVFFNQASDRAAFLFVRDVGV